MQAVVLYYKLEPVELLPGLIGYKVAKEKEELVNVKDEEEAEKTTSQDTSHMSLVIANKFRVVNTPGLMRYTLPEPLKLLRIGYPKDLQNVESVGMEYLTFFDKDYKLIGVDINENFDKPFVVLDFENGFTKIISKGEINSKPKGTKESTAKKSKNKAKSKKKKSAKRAGSRQKAKSKSARKS